MVRLGRTCNASANLLSTSRTAFLTRREKVRRCGPVREFKFPGGHTARVTPVPIPNTEVKPRRADDTARATVWERRSSPGLKLINGQIFFTNIWPFCFLTILFCYCARHARFFACLFFIVRKGAHNNDKHA